MKITDKLLQHDLEILRHGGPEAIQLFLEMGRKCYEKGNTEYLDHWVALAMNVLPESDRTGVVAGFMRGFFGEAAIHIKNRDEEHHTLH